MESTELQGKKVKLWKLEAGCMRKEPLASPSVFARLFFPFSTSYSTVVVKETSDYLTYDFESVHSSIRRGTEFYSKMTDSHCYKETHRLAHKLRCKI